jgi:hypothetical protein
MAGPDATGRSDSAKDPPTTTADRRTGKPSANGVEVSQEQP